MIAAMVAGVPNGQDQDELRARALVSQIGGLTETFSDAEFLNRAAVKELLVLDRASVLPLQEVLAESADWSARATAAYLLLQINDTSTFLQAWNSESNAIVKTFLFPGARRYVADYGVLLRELNQMSSLTEARRDSLQELSDKLPSLSDAQVLLWTKRLTTCLTLPHDPQAVPSMPPDARRVVPILERAGEACLPALIDAFYTASTDDARWGALWAMGEVVGRIADDPMHAAKAECHLAKLLELASQASAQASLNIRNRSLELMIGLAVLMDTLGKNPEQILALLKRVASGDSSEEVRVAARRWLTVWEERKPHGRTEHESPKTDPEVVPGPLRDKPLSRDGVSPGAVGRPNPKRSTYYLGAGVVLLVALALTVAVAALLRRRRWTSKARQL
jgi:hypothetical protein